MQTNYNSQSSSQYSYFPYFDLDNISLPPTAHEVPFPLLDNLDAALGPLEATQPVQPAPAIDTSSAGQGTHLSCFVACIKLNLDHNHNRIIFSANRLEYFKSCKRRNFRTHYKTTGRLQEEQEQGQEQEAMFRLSGFKVCRMFRDPLLIYHILKKKNSSAYQLKVTLACA